MKDLKEFKPLLKLLGKDKYKLIIICILLLLSSISFICVGYLNGAAVEAITNTQLDIAIIYLVIYFLMEVLLDGYLSITSHAWLHKIECNLTNKLGYNTYAKALELPSVAYEKYSSGEVINRITNDADSLNAILEELLWSIGSLISAIIILVYVFFNSWIVGLELIVMMLLLLVVLKYYYPKLKKVRKERSEVKDKFTSLTSESIKGIREIKTLGIKKILKSNSKNIIDEIYDKSIQEIYLDRRLEIINKVLRAVLEVGVFITCAILVYYEQVSLTFFIAMTYYVYRYMWLMENINNLIKNYQKLVVSIGRVNEILENKLYQDEKFGSIELTNPKGIIEFKNVTFNYPNEGVTLKNFNLKIEPNKKIAIVGSSGGGKTTLFNLLTRIFDTEKGELLIDGINIKDLKEESLRETISIIRQDPFIFHRTIKENFLLLDKKIKLEDIRKYTKMAYLDDYIMSLPKKYNTLLGEGGVNLSGGQKQRLSIARTLAKNSKIILFDEATSALDNESQDFIKRSIDDLIKDHTVVIIAHRLSTIIDADVIHVVDKGKVIASGTHKELLKSCDTYKKLYQNETIN